MLPFRTVFGPAIVIVAIGCARDVAPAPIDPPATQTSAPAQLLIEQLPALRSVLSLGDWKRTYPADAIELYSPEDAESSYENWCARAEATVMFDSASAARRTVYFYPPAAPDPPVLPTALGPGQLVDQCRLGFVWIEARERDAERTTRITNENVDALSAILDAPQTDTDVMWFGAANWRNTHFWRSHMLSVVVASTEDAAWGEAASDSATRILVIAAGPASGIDLEWTSESSAPTQWLKQQHYEANTLRNAIGLADADAELTEAMLAFVARFAPELLYSHVFTEPELAGLFDALLHWLDGTAGLPVERRAAALVAADVFMTHFRLDGALAGPDEAAPVRARLEERGAEFTYSPLGATHIYKRSWIKEAHRLDPGGTAGELAFLLLMDVGFETNLCRDQGGLGFRAVIEQGEAFLRAKPHAAISGDVHIMVAQAYADIVTLASGGGGGYADSSEYVAEAPAARARAVEHYHAALDMAGAAFHARDSWPTAWRLMAGLSPTRTFFYCIYD